MKKILLLLTVALTASLASAQESDTPVTEGADSSTSAWLRVWVMIPPEALPKTVGDQPSLNDKLSLLIGSEGQEPHYLVSNATPFQTTGYIEIPPNPQQIRLVKPSGDSVIDLARVSVQPKAGSFLTAVVQKSGAGYSLALIDDTPKPPPPAQPGQPPPPPPKQILFYNFLPEFSSEVLSEDPSFTRPLVYGRPQIVTGLPAKLFYVQMPRKTGNRTNMSNTEVDTQLNDSLSFLVIKDFYGRVVAKLLPNGKLD